MTAARMVQRADGVLASFNAAGVLDAGDVHVALRLGRLGAEADSRVLLATALAVRAVRSGSVCLDLARMREVTVDEEFDVDPTSLPWPEESDVETALRESPLVVGTGIAGELSPLRLVDVGSSRLLYLDRYFRQEQTVRRVLDERMSSRPVVDDAALAAALAARFPGTGPDRQRLAAVAAATGWTSVVAGGPGTGKTHTVARILAVLFELYGPTLRVALAAPTGKAAARLQETVRGQAQQLDLPPGVEASTVHRLLGWRRGGAGPRHGSGNRLPFDVVVVDETSMVSLTMMCRLLEAVRPDTRLVLVGDPDQLASVDAGAVLADLVARPVSASAPAAQVAADPTSGPSADPESLTRAEAAQLAGGIVTLRRERRFRGAVADLASAIRAGAVEDVVAVLADGGPDVVLESGEDTDALRGDVVDSAAAVTAAARAAGAADSLQAMGIHRLLCAHRRGPFGAETWARRARQWVTDGGVERPGGDRWYPGQPLLVTANDYDARVYNGDTGVIVAMPDGALRAAFQRGAEPYLVHPDQLPAVQTVYAMTIHRSQGSQYDTVSVILPSEASSLLSRELLYTAVTRARRRVRIVGTEQSVRAAVAHSVQRASGLRREIRWHS